MREKELYWVLGDVYTFLHTEKGMSILEVRSDEGHGPPPHAHQNEEESFYVLEGELAVQLGEETMHLGAGSFVHIPRGVRHSYKTTSSTGARHLTVITPGGFEQLFRRIGTPYRGELSDPADRGAAIKTLLELAPDFGLVVGGL